jgi:hypothetical protein
MSRTLRLLLSSAVVVVLVSIALLAFPPVYQQNDDVVMTMIASGRGIAAVPDAHLVFVNLALGGLLRRLYGWAPAVPWYGLTLVGGVAVTLTTLLGFRLGRRRESWGRGLRPWPALAAYCGTVGVVFLARLQFTAVAGLASAAGLALWMPPHEAERGPEPRPRRVVAAALLLFGGLLRFQALLLVLVVAMPVLSDRLRRAGRATGVRLAGGLLAVLATSAVLQWADRRIYDAEPGWREFLELNAWRARIVDYGAGGDGPERRLAEQRLGWSPNDGLVLRRWLYTDRSVFPTSSLRRFVEAAPVAQPGPAEALGRLRAAFATPSLVPLLLTLPLLALGVRRGERLRVLLLAAAPAVVVIGVLAVLLRAPEHVALPALAFVPTALLVLGDDQGESRRALGWPAVALAAAGAWLAFDQARVEAALALEENRDLRLSLAQLGGTGTRLYVEWAGAFRYEGVLPLEDQSYLAGVRLFSLGWPQRSPVADELLRRLEMHDVLRCLYERDDVGLVMNPAWRESLAAYLSEHHGVQVRFREAVRTPSFTVFRVERTDVRSPQGSPATP